MQGIVQTPHQEEEPEDEERLAQDEHEAEVDAAHEEEAEAAHRSTTVGGFRPLVQLLGPNSTGQMTLQI